MGDPADSGGDAWESVSEKEGGAEESEQQDPGSARGGDTQSTRGGPGPYLADRSAVNTRTRRLILKAAEAASILARKLHLVG